MGTCTATSAAFKDGAGEELQKANAPLLFSPERGRDSPAVYTTVSETEDAPALAIAGRTMNRRLQF